MIINALDTPTHGTNTLSPGSRAESTPMTPRMHTLALATMIVLGTAVLPVATADDTAAGANSEWPHFDAKGKPPSQFTIDILNEARETLPFRVTGH